MRSTRAVAASIQATSPELMPSVTIGPGTAGMMTARMLMAINKTRNTIDFFIVKWLRLFYSRTILFFVKNQNIRVVFYPLFKINYRIRLKYGKI